MKVNIELDSDALIDGLVFHGETYADKRVIGKLYELEQILDDVIVGLRSLDYQVSRRQEASAKEIKDKIDQMGIYLGINFTFEEDVELEEKRVAIIRKDKLIDLEHARKIELDRLYLLSKDHLVAQLYIANQEKAGLSKELRQQKSRVRDLNNKVESLEQEAFHNEIWDRKIWQ